jgi:NAD(P)-dependent dehydrogenase (short-subunit alcohol dehydrogenase family)
MYEKQVAVVTGASSGIGQAIAGRLAASGYRVFGASRTAPMQADGEIEGAEIKHVRIDVTDDDSVRDGVAWIVGEAGRIDVLVNSAGYLSAGAIEEVPLDEAKAQFETNYFGVVRMTLAVLPVMRRQKCGHIISVSSLASQVPVPFWGQYNASKFAVDGLMETLRHEVRPFGIQVAMVEPGFIRTPFYGRPPAPGIDAYARPRDRAFEVIAKFEASAPGPEVVAHRVVKIARAAHPRLRNTVGRQAAQLTTLRWLLPSGAFESGVRRTFNLGAG